MATEAARASLLGLPCELRLQIFSYLLVNDEDPPPNRWEAGDRERRKYEIYLLDDDPALHFTQVSAINRSVHDEVHKYMDGGSVRGDAELDLMIVGYEFWPTWTRLPALLRPGKPFDLNLTLRIYSTDVFPTLASRAIYWLLKSLLRNGPRLVLPRDATTREREREPFHIDTLSVSVVFHDNYTPMTHPGAVAEIFRCFEQLAYSNVPWQNVKRISVHAEYDGSQGRVCESREWLVKETVGLIRDSQEWKEYFPS